MDSARGAEVPDPVRRVRVLVRVAIDAYCVVEQAHLQHHQSRLAEGYSTRIQNERLVRERRRNILVALTDAASVICHSAAARWPAARAAFLGRSLASRPVSPLLPLSPPV